MPDDDGPLTIGYDEAVAMLPDGDTVHTFVNPGPTMLLGADWSREQILDAMREAKEIHRTGEAASSMNHGLAIPRDKGWLFIETKKPAKSPDPDSPLWKEQHKET